MPTRLVELPREGRPAAAVDDAGRSVALLVAQLAINVVVAVGGLLVLIVVGNLAFEVPLPQHLLGFAAAFLLGMSSLFALGLLVAAVAPSSTAANALIWPSSSRSCSSAASTCRGGSCPTSWSGSASSPRPACRRMLDAWLGAPRSSCRWG